VGKVSTIILLEEMLVLLPIQVSQSDSVANCSLSNLQAHDRKKISSYRKWSSKGSPCTETFFFAFSRGECFSEYALTCPYWDSAFSKANPRKRQSKCISSHDLRSFLYLPSKVLVWHCFRCEKMNTSWFEKWDFYIKCKKRCSIYSQKYRKISRVSWYIGH
jgi:hypothetical protein